MAVPLTVQLFDAFLGTQEGIHSIILPDIFSSGGSKNVYIDKFGRVKRIAGFDNRNSTAFTTNTGASAVLVRGLIPYRSTVGGSTTRKLLMVFDDGTNEWEVWVSGDNGTTGGLLYDAGAGSVGAIPDAAQFDDDLYLTNGKIQPRIYDGVTMAATGLTQSPTPASADSGDSGNLKGNYKYKLVSTIAGVRQYGSAAATSLLVVDKQVDLSWTADANTSVDGYEIYRTTGNGTTYYYLTTIPGRTTVAYVDNTSDLTLLEQRVMEEHGDAPPVAYYCEPHKQRMWWLRTDAYPTRGYWSDPGEPESVYSENFLNFSDSETVGDVITGAMGNYEGLFVVFTEKTIWTVTGTGAIIGDITDWTKTRTNVTTGCVTHRSAARVPAGSKYTDQLGASQTTSVSAIAYWTPDGSIRLFDGDNDLDISHPVRDTIRSYAYQYRTKIHVLDDTHNSQLIWFFPSASATEPDSAVVWNYQYGVWYKWTSQNFASSAVVDTATDPHLLITGEARLATGGYVYTYFEGNHFNGANIDAQWMTKTLYGTNENGDPAMSHRKRWRWLDVVFQVNSDVDISVSWLPGNASDTASPIDTIVVSPAEEAVITMDGSMILSADGSSIVIAAASAQDKALLKVDGGDYLHDEGIRLRVGTNDMNGQWALEAMQLAYQLLPGLRRRNQ